MPLLLRILLSWALTVASGFFGLMSWSAWERIQVLQSQNLPAAANIMTTSLYASGAFVMIIGPVAIGMWVYVVLYFFKKPNGKRAH